MQILGTAAVRPLLQLDVQELHLLCISSKIKHQLYGYIVDIAKGTTRDLSFECFLIYQQLVSNELMVVPKE